MYRIFKAEVISDFDRLGRDLDILKGHMHLQKHHDVTTDATLFSCHWHFSTATSVHREIGLHLAAQLIWRETNSYSHGDGYKLTDTRLATVQPKKLKFWESK